MASWEHFVTVRPGCPKPDFSRRLDALRGPPEGRGFSPALPHPWVESRMGAVGATKPPRFPSPLIEPDVRISRIRLSDKIHDEAHG